MGMTSRPFWKHAFVDLTHKRRICMNGLTNYITERPWEDTITAWYVYVDDAYQRVMQRHSEW
jgi:hypothetical protein